MSPERKPETTTREILALHDLKLGLFDLDGTLVRTAKVFNEQRNLYLKRVRHLLPQLDEETLRTTFNQAWALTKERYSVRPDVTSHTILSFAQLCGIADPQRLLQLGEPLKHIYEDIPAVKTEVIPTLIDLNNSGLNMAILTHANEDWSARKLDYNFLTGFNVTPQQAFMVGDNLYSDIIPALEAGLKYAVLIEDPDSERKYNLKDIPSEAIVIPQMGDLIPTLANLAV